MRIAILISGQMRGSPFSNVNSNECSQDILDSWTRFLFTPEFKENNEYIIFVATDAINQCALEEYFGKDRIGGLEVCDGERGIEEWGAAYLTRPHKHPTAWVGYRAIWQWYRLYRVWLLMKNSGINYDCVIRLRPDTIIHSSCQNTLEQLGGGGGGGGGAQLYMAWDILAIGRPSIMEAYCSLIKTVGAYVPQPDTYNFSHNGLWSKKTHRQLIADAGYLFSPEMQLIELLMEWVIRNGCGQTIDQTIVNSDIGVSLDKKDFRAIDGYRWAGN